LPRPPPDGLPVVLGQFPPGTWPPPFEAPPLLEPPLPPVPLEPALLPLDPLLLLLPMTYLPFASLGADGTTTVSPARVVRANPLDAHLGVRGGVGT
jgi:hypothetical protein